MHDKHKTWVGSQSNKASAAAPALLHAGELGLSHKSADGSIYSGDWYCDERSGDGRQKQIVAEEPTAQVTQGRQLAFLEDGGLRDALKTFGFGGAIGEQRQPVQFV